MSKLEQIVDAANIGGEELTAEMVREGQATTWHYGLWFGDFVINGETKANLMIKAYRPVEETEQWTVIARLRRIVDNKIFNSKDDRAWKRMKIVGNESTMLEVVNELTTYMGNSVTEFKEQVAGMGARVEGSPPIFDFLPTGCTGDKLTEVFRNANRSWLNWREEHADGTPVGGSPQSPPPEGPVPKPLLSNEQIDEVFSSLEGIAAFVTQCTKIDDEGPHETELRLSQWLYERIKGEPDVILRMLCKSIAKHSVELYQKQLLKKQLESQLGIELE